MGKWILIPDSFKGTMSSEEICTVMAAALRRHLPEADIVSVPVADGGEEAWMRFSPHWGAAGRRSLHRPPTDGQSPHFTAVCRMGPQWWRWRQLPAFR